MGGNLRQGCSIPPAISMLDLLGDVIPQAWLPGETLFSLCSRHHRLSKNLKASSTCLQLFGHRSQGAAHDLPSRISHLVEVTRGQLGSVESIIREHTVLPYYLPFARSLVESGVFGAMGGTSIGSLKYQLGLLTSRFRANHPLKACNACVAEDRNRWGVSYWHVHHQLPGVWVCPTHGELLARSSLKATGVKRFLWCLPERSHLIPLAATTASLRPLASIAQLAIALWSLPAGTRFDLTRVSNNYRQALRDRGLIKGAGRGRLVHKEIGALYASFIEPLRQIDELHALPSTAEAAALEVARLSYGPRSGQHPLRHISMIAWLFSSLDSFIDRMNDDLAIGPFMNYVHTDAGYAKREHDTELRQKLLQRVSKGQSVSSAARQIGIDPNTGMAWLTSAGVVTSKRPSVMKEGVRRKMIAALKRGASKSEVASAVGLSIESVTRLLRTEVGLREAWATAKFSKAQRRVRHAFEMLIECNPNTGIKALRMLRPDIYAWLYRNDREWLTEQSRRLIARPKHGGLRVDWDARDKDLALQVAKVSLSLATEARGSRVKLWQIYQRLPELKAKLGHLDKLPLTLQAIRTALSALPSGGLQFD